MYNARSKTSVSAKFFEDHLDLISGFLTPSDLRNLSQTNSYLYNLHASQQAWKSLMKVIFTSNEPSTARTTNLEEEKSQINTQNSLSDTPTHRSRTELRTPKAQQLRRDVLNSTIDPEEKIILQPLRSPIDFLLDKPQFSEKDLNEIKTILREKADKFTQSTRKLEGLFVLSNQHNQSLVSEVNSLMELKADFDERLKIIETDSMRRLLEVVRGTLSKRDSGVREAYKEYMQKKRASEHYKAELEEVISLISQVKVSYQACLLAGVEKYAKNISNILVWAGEIQEKAQVFAENFNHFLFNKLYELMVTRLPEQRIDLERVFGMCEDQVYREKIRGLYEVMKSISSKWEELAKQRETQAGKFSTRDNLLGKKLNHVTDVLKSLYRFGEKLAKAKQSEPTSGTLKPIGGIDKGKKLARLYSIASPINMSFNIFDWNQMLQWGEVKEKIIKELSELEEQKEDTTVSTNATSTSSGVKAPRAKIRIKKDLGPIGQPVEKEIFSKTTAGGFFKSPPLKKVEVARPKSSYKENRSEITQEEEEYLQSTFHPGVKWKII